MSQKKIKVPAPLLDGLNDRARAAARVVAASLVGLAVVSLVCAVASGSFFLLWLAGLVSPLWACAVPACASVTIGVVACGVAVDVVRGLRRE